MSDKDAKEESRKRFEAWVLSYYLCGEEMLVRRDDSPGVYFHPTIEHDFFVWQIAERTQAPSMALEYEPKSDIQFQWCNSMRHDPNIGYYVQRLQAYAPFELARILESYSAGTQAQAAQVCRNPFHYRTDGSLEPHEIGASCMAEPTESLLRKPGTLPEGCYCEPGKCGAPVIMGRQMPCRDPKKPGAPVAALEGNGEKK